MNTARLVDNRTPLACRGLPMDDDTGWEVLVTVARLTWKLPASGEAYVPRHPAPIRMGPERHEGSRSIRYPSDVAAFKPGTDVLLVGTVQPGERSETRREVSLRLVRDGSAVVDKTLWVHGPRVWREGLRGVVPGPAAGLVATPLTWEHAWGGRDPDEPSLVARTNPLGRGFAKDSSRLVGEEAPRIEDPAAPPSARKPRSAGFGAIDAHFSPRAERAGSHDAHWRRTRAPLAPEDRDPRFACVAPDDQWARQPLRGDESVEVAGLDAGAPWRFRLPRYEPRFTARVDDEDVVLDSHLDTFLIDAETRCVELTWRASVRLPKKSERLRWVRIAGDNRVLRDRLASSSSARPEAAAISG